MSLGPEVKARTEVRDGMRIDRHVQTAMDDGLALRADVYRPVEDGRYPGNRAAGCRARDQLDPDGVLRVL
ncbi:MAG: hypothetical protein HYR52_05270 [Candidatus Tectomicrobia bacterium]|nr:hypothetical protein [Candidatus Tectomicrobia bacterium]